MSLASQLQLVRGGDGSAELLGGHFHHPRLRRCPRSSFPQEVRWISRLIGAVFFLVPTRSASSAREPIESPALGHLRSGELGSISEYSF